MLLGSVTGENIGDVMLGHVDVPVAVSVFPDEIYAAPRSLGGKAYPKLIHYSKLPRGGHFAAWEQPELLTAELRSAFTPYGGPRWASNAVRR
jgi:pimeloyl-ACP methyl ester carboxylesterase